MSVPCLIFLLSSILLFPVLCSGSIIGVCYGRNADDLPTPDKVAQLVQLHNIKYVRIYDSNIQVLRAFSNIDVELMIGVTNIDLLPFSQYQSNVDSWVKNNILPYYPAAKITSITVGAEATESPGSPSNVTLDYALFSSTSDVVDPNTGLVYSNMFDAQIDALFFALSALNFKILKIAVTETGWPSKGSAKETAATPDNAQTYNTNLIRHVINNTGTPARPGEEIDVYIFSLFNENRKPGPESERNWGLYYPDQTSIYNLDLTGRGAVDITTQTNITSSNGTWCIASPNAMELDLQSALDWACGSGNVDCSAIQPSQPCFQPDTLQSHASFAFNGYYQQNGATDIACSFGGSGIKTTQNPSYDACLYLTTGSNKAPTNSSAMAPVAATSESNNVLLGYQQWIMLLFSLLSLSFLTA